MSIVNETTYKDALTSLLKELAKHPDFAEIEALVNGKMPISAAVRVKEIIGQQETFREALESVEFDPIIGMWLSEGKSTDDDSPIIIPETVQHPKPAGDGPYFVIPKSGDSDDDDFSVITFD